MHYFAKPLERYAANNFPKTTDDFLFCIGLNKHPSIVLHLAALVSSKTALTVSLLFTHYFLRNFLVKCVVKIRTTFLGLFCFL